jgi:methylated-DNA-protein-cysteine methyltransferase-like protein
VNEAYVERVLAAVETVAPGHVTTYGLVADRVGGGPRQVGSVLSHFGHSVPWWRCVRADGRLAPHLMLDAQEHWALEKTPVKNGRVDMALAVDPDFVG